MKRGINLIVILTVICLIYIAGCRRAGAWLVKEDESVHADAIVILMGTIADRVLQAVDLYKQEVADKVIFAEVSVTAYQILEARGFHIKSTAEEVHDALITLGIPSDNVNMLPGDATSTLMEALIVRDYLNNNPGIDTLLIISSAPHTRRASIIFKTVIKKSEMPVTVLCSPSSYSKYNSEKWWHTKDGIRVVLLEYLKLADFVLFEKRKLIEN